jgi:small subunit ribosomal protein S18
MANKKHRARTKDASPRKYKKKTSPLLTESVQYVDYKDVDLLQRFMSDRAKIRNRRVTGNDVQQQREVANAIKIAREMGLLPYARRVASSGRQRGPRDGDGRGARTREGAGDTINEPVQAEVDTNVDVDIDEADEAIEGGEDLA